MLKNCGFCQLADLQNFAHVKSHQMSYIPQDRKYVQYNRRRKLHRSLYVYVYSKCTKCFFIQNLKFLHFCNRMQTVTLLNRFASFFQNDGEIVRMTFKLQQFQYRTPQNINQPRIVYGDLCVYKYCLGIIDICNLNEATNKYRSDMLKKHTI